MKKVFKILQKTFPWLLVALIGIFFYNTLSENADKLKGFSLNFDVWAGVGIILWVFAVVTSGVLWGVLLAKIIARHVDMRDAVRIHAASWLLKYIPGQVGSYLNKIAWGKTQGISKKAISTSFIYENVLMVVAGVSLSLPVISLYDENVDLNLGVVAPILIVFPMMIVFSRKLFYALINRMFRLVGRKSLDKADFLTGRDLVKYQIAYLLPRLLNGIGFVLVVQSLFDVQPHMYIGIGATYILASIVGLLAVFVPGGLGVREAVIVAFLSAYFPIEQAIIISLVARLYATLSDLGVLVVYIILKVFGKRREARA